MNRQPIAEQGLTLVLEEIKVSKAMMKFGTLENVIEAEVSLVPRQPSPFRIHRRVDEMEDTLAVPAQGGNCIPACIEEFLEIVGDMDAP